MSMIKLSTYSGRGGVTGSPFYPFQPNSTDTGTDLKSETGSREVRKKIMNFSALGNSSLC